MENPSNPLDPAAAPLGSASAYPPIIPAAAEVRPGVEAATQSLAGSAKKESPLLKPLTFLSIAVSIVLIYYGAPVLLPFLLASFLFLLLDPMVSGLEKRGIPRVVSGATGVVLAVVVIGATGFAFYNALKGMADRIPQYSTKIYSVTKSFHGTANKLGATAQVFLEGKVPQKTVTPGDSDNDADSTAAPPASPVRSMTPFLLRGVSSVISLISWLFFIPLISLFFLLEKRALAERIAKAVGNYDRFERICTQMRELAHGFFLGNFVVWAFMTSVFLAAFSAMKLEAAFQLALFAGFLNLVPVFGVLLGGILPGAQAFLQFDGLGTLMTVALVSIVAHFVGNNIIMPKFLGNRVNVNASAAMIGFLFWGAVWGAPGLFLAIPLVATIRIFLESSERWAEYADLLSETPTSTRARLALGGVFRKGS